jgi:hypothetical protein
MPARGGFLFESPPHSCSRVKFPRKAAFHVLPRSSEYDSSQVCELAVIDYCRRRAWSRHLRDVLVFPDKGSSDGNLAGLFPSERS